MCRTKTNSDQSYPPTTWLIKTLTSAIILVSVLSGCSTRNFDTYAEAISKFQTATTQTSAVAIAYFDDLNEYERGLTLARLRNTPSLPLNIDTMFLTDLFDPNAIELRRQAFQVIRTYTDLLAQLATSDAAERWQASTVKLKDSANGLLSTIGKLENSDDARETTVAEQAAGFLQPLQILASFAGAELINMKRADALDRAIKTASPAIESLSAALKDDMETVYVQRASTVDDPLARLGIAYTKAQQANEEAMRLRLLDELERALAERNKRLAELRNIESALDGFDRSHAALVAYAESEKSPQSLADLLSEVERYAAVAGNAYEALTEARKGLKADNQAPQ